MVIRIKKEMRMGEDVRWWFSVVFSVLSGGSRGVRYGCRGWREGKWEVM